jgi:hypothetical protein
MRLPTEIWISIIKYIEINDLINLCAAYKQISILCEAYPCNIYKEILRCKGFHKFKKFNINVFTNFCKIDSKLLLNAYNILYAYECGYIDVVKFLLDNIKKSKLYESLDTQKIAENVHSYWSFQFRGIGMVMDVSVQEELLISLIDFNINKSNIIDIPDKVSKYLHNTILQKLHMKIDFQSMTSLFFNISVLKNDWKYIEDTMDIIGLQYYEDAY